MEDMQIGPFKCGGKFDKELAKEYLGEIVHDLSLGEDWLKTERYQFKNGSSITVQDNKVSVIHILAPDKIATARGLTIGDSFDKLKQLYGEPSQIDKIMDFESYTYMPQKVDIINDGQFFLIVILDESKRVVEIRVQGLKIDMPS